MKKIISLVLALTMLCSMIAIPVSAETSAENKIWFDLNGNSRFFVEKGAGIFENRTTYTDYLPGVDFVGFVAAPTGDFATDQAAVTNPGYGGCMFVYTVDNNTKGSQYAMPDFTTGDDGNLYWNINDVAYRINPNANVIKVVKNAVDTSALTDADMIARYESINKEAVIDVKDGNYKNVGLLVGLASNYSRTASVTLVYEDTTAEEKIDVATSALSADTSYLTGYFYLQNFTNTTGGGSNASGGHGFIPFTIETDPTKTLTEIRIKDGATTSVANSFYVVSAWGVTRSLDEYIAELNELIEKATTVEELEAIDVEAVEELFGCVLNEQKAIIANKIAELSRVDTLKQREMYYYPVEYNRDAFFTVAEALEFGAFDASGNPWPTKDLAGNPLDTTAPWFGTKGLVRLLGTNQKSASGFLIDSIKGVEGQVTAQRYTSSACETIGTASKKLIINGNPNFELQSTDANGAENYIYNANGFKYKLGPIGGSAHRTADGGYNVRALLEGEVYKFERVQDGAQKFGMLLASKQNNEGTSYAALQKIEITYNDGKAKETKYLVVTNMTQDDASHTATTYDGDRLGRIVVAVPKTVDGAEIDHTTGSVLKANAKIVSESNSEELIGKAITVEDVVFPADFVVGESVAIADLGIGRNSAVTNGKRYCPGGYANHFELDFGEDVTAIDYKGGISYGKTYPGAILNGQVAYIPVTIPGASEDYLYYARFGRPCGNYMYLMGASSMGGALEDRIVEIEAQFEAAETKEEIISAYDAMEAVIEASAGVIRAEDFNKEVAAVKLTAHIKADIEAAKSSADIEAIRTEIAKYLTAYGNDTKELEDAIKEKLVAIERFEELSKGDKYELADIDWDYVDNSQYLINAFEMSSVLSIESTTDYYASISGQSYINTKSTYEHITIAEALAKEEAETDGDSVKNYTGSSIGYSFYPTDKIQAKTGTFPAADGKYYITAPSGAKFEIKGVTNEVGANGNNAGYLTFDETNKENGGSIYKVDFDGKTPYNKVNLLVTGVSEPVWNGSPRQNSVAQANIYYADGSSESQIILIPSLWGYVPTIAGKLKTQDKVTGLNTKHPYVDANSTVLALCSSDKFNWVPSNVDAEVFDLGSYMTTTFTNTAEERHTFKEMTNRAGTLASVSVDTKGKAVDYVEIAPAEVDVLEAAGAFSAATNNDSHVYWLPIANEDVLELVGEDKAGVLGDPKKENHQIYLDAKVSECDFYLKVQRNAAYSGRGTMAVLFAANAEKKYENLLAYIEEATAAMESVSENSKLEEVFAANEIYENALAQEGINATDFDANLVAKFNALINTVKEKTDVKGVLEVKYFENAATTVDVKLTNLAELEGKNFAVLLTYLNEDGKVVGSKTFTGVSTAAKEQTVTFEDENAPAGAVEVKAYLWKALGSLKPLGEAVVAKKSSYAVDRFFDIEEGKFKEDATGDLNILFLGDSLTEGSSTYEIDGENADRPDHWTNVIAMYMKDQLPSMKVNVLNGGIGGTTTSFQSPILDGYALTCEPDIVFIQNVNNYNSSSTKSAVESVEAIVRSLLKLEKVPTIIYYHAYSPYTPEDPDVTYPVTVQTNRPNEVQEKHRDDIDALLAEYNIASLDYITYFRDLTKDCTDEIMTDYYNANNVHPKTAGYKLMGDYATAEFFIDASAFFKRNVLKAEANSATADDVYKVTYPNDSRFTYKNFNIIGEADAAANDINKRQYAFPFKGNVAQARVGGAEIEFTTTAKEISIYYVNPTSKYRTNKVKIYVDGEFVRDGAGANPYASNYDNIKIQNLDGNKHTIKLVTDAPSQHESGSTLDIFNFMFLAEKQ